MSSADTKATLEALGLVLGTCMTPVAAVHVEGLGTFYYTCISTGKGVDTAEKVNANQISGTRVRFVPESHRQGTTITRGLIGENVTWANINSISQLVGTGSAAAAAETEDRGKSVGITETELRCDNRAGGEHGTHAPLRPPPMQREEQQQTGGQLFAVVLFRNELILRGYFVRVHLFFVPLAYQTSKRNMGIKHFITKEKNYEKLQNHQ